MDNNNNDSGPKDWVDLGYDPVTMEKKSVVEERERSHKRQMEQDEHEARMRLLELQQQKELQSKAGQTGEPEQILASSKSDVQQLVNAIPKADKRLKAVRKIAALYETKEILSDYEIAKCIFPRLTKKDYSHNKLKSKIRTRIRTPRKYWKPLGLTLSRVQVPVPGYHLRQIT